MSCSLNKGITETIVHFKRKGFFKRLIDTFIILGYPTAYGSWIPFGSKEEVIFKENNISLRMPTDRVNLVDILDFKPPVFEKEFKAKYRDAFYDRGLDYRLTDYLVVFIASNIARYRPSLWRTIIDRRGEIESRFNQRIRTAYTNYAEGMQYSRSRNIRT